MPQIVKRDVKHLAHTSLPSIGSSARLRLLLTNRTRVSFFALIDYKNGIRYARCLRWSRPNGKNIEIFMLAGAPPSRGGRGGGFSRGGDRGGRGASRGGDRGRGQLFVRDEA